MASNILGDDPTLGSVGTTTLDVPIGVLDNGSLEARVLQATVRCLGRWGMAKTTVDDIAREAGCGRASIYRLFPGGKDALLVAAGQYEEARFFALLADRFDQAESLDDLLLTAITEASSFLREHEALQYLLAHEPEAVLPLIAFDRIGPVLHRVAAHAGPFLARFVDDRTATEITEWATRLVISYALAPSPHFDLRDPVAARRLLSQYLLPGLADPNTYNASQASPANAHRS